MFCEEAVINLSGEETVHIRVFGEFLENGYFSICVILQVLMMPFILLPYCLMSLRGSIRTAMTLLVLTMIPRYTLAKEPSPRKSVSLY